MGEPRSGVAAYIGIMLICIAPISIYTVRYFAEPGFPIHSYFTLVLGYYAAFAIILLVPIHISTTHYETHNTLSTL
jgi:membrane protein YdbS with pleckstrin-like domain